MIYKPGLHIICDCESSESSKLSDYHAFKILTNQLIEVNNLQKIGEVYHNFEGGGYTGIVCLTESHISIHTWPEFRKITFDVFLSNFMHVNEHKVYAIFEEYIQFFNATITQKHEISR